MKAATNFIKLKKYIFAEKRKKKKKRIHVYYPASKQSRKENRRSRKTEG